MKPKPGPLLPGTLKPSPRLNNLSLKPPVMMMAEAGGKIVNPIQHANAQVELDPGNAVAHCNLGVVLGSAEAWGTEPRIPMPCNCLLFKSPAQGVAWNPRSFDPVTTLSVAVL